MPSPLLTELRVVSGGVVGDRDKDQGKIKGVCKGSKRGGRSWGEGGQGPTTPLHLLSPQHLISAMEKRLVSSCMLSGLYSPPLHAACSYSMLLY